jgi:LysR family nitrogen assimilation transcriptional regulator
VLVSSVRSSLEHGALVRLASLPRIKLVMPSKINTRRQTLETYCTTVGVEIERLLELDAMLGTLDFVSRTDWLTILPGIMMADDSDVRQFTVNPIVDPRLNLDLVLIEPSSRPLSRPAELFLAMLEREVATLSRRWLTLEDDATSKSK